MLCDIALELVDNKCMQLCGLLSVGHRLRNITIELQLVAAQAISLVAWRRHISASFTGMNFSSAKLGFRSAVRYRGLDHLCVAIFPGPVHICHKPVTIRALELHRFHARSFQTSSHMYGMIQLDCPRIIKPTA